jgi:hypothetical protein
VLRPSAEGREEVQRLEAQIPCVSAEASGQVAALVEPYLKEGVHEDFFESLECFGLGQSRHQPDAVVDKLFARLVPPRSTRVCHKNLKAFKSLLFAHVGPLAKVDLPEGAYLTGSLMAAAATIDEASLHIVPDLAELWDRGLPYDEHATAVDELFGLRGRWVWDASSQEEIGVLMSYQLVVDTEDGEGSYARADIDVALVACSDEEATALLASVVKQVKEHFGTSEHVVLETPNSILLVGHFPMKHVQVIKLYTRSIEEYLLFVDLDCTALAFDGHKLIGLRRTLLCYLSGYNYITAKMLEIRKDTPKRIAKYARRGFGVVMARTRVFPEKWSELPGLMAIEPKRFSEFRCLSGDKEESSDHVLRAILEPDNRQCLHLNTRRENHAPTDPSPFRTGDAFFIFSNGEDKRAYRETNLPRGWYFCPWHMERFLEICHLKAEFLGKAPLVTIFTGGANAINKFVAKREAWWFKFGVV